MKQQQSDAAGQAESWLTALVARSLEISASQLDAKTHFSRYGLDSVSAVSIMTEISDRTGLVIAEDVLLDYPTISQLAQHISDRSNHTYDAVSSPGGHTNLHVLMQQDSMLPADIQPPQGEVAANPTAILLTGATGFLGIHLLDVLMRKTTAHIYCLIRSSKGGTPSERLASAFYQYGIEHQNLEHRVTVLCGDICEPQLGLPDKTFEHLAASIDSIYHSAADVNLAMDYISLRERNVLPVVALLRLSCLRKKKHFVFVSSISVCYAYSGPDTITENTSALSLIEGIHLGYAQSKAIAEALCEQALVRGLPVTVHRSALLLGNSVTGQSKHDDLLSRMIKGCIVMGCAPDLNWPIDACPVNEVADAIYSLSIKKGAPLSVTHLVHPQPQYWREIVSWMNIYGYPMELLPYSKWVTLLHEIAHSTDHPLYSLRYFFIRQLSEADGLTHPEIYEEHRRSKIMATNTTTACAARSLEYTPLDSALLERYFEVFIDVGFLQKTNQQGLP